MGVRTVTCDLGPTRVCVVADHDTVVDHLGDFYPLVDAPATAGTWVVEAAVGPAGTGLPTNEWGVGVVADRPARRLRLRGPDPLGVAVTARGCVREALVDYCERRRYAMLHASAVVDRRRVIVFVGDRGTGKTTLGLKAALGHRMRYLSNDHLIVLPDGHPPRASGLRLTALPGPISVRIGTYLDLEDRLPPPLDTEDVDLDSYRGVPARRRYAVRRRVVYTLPRLGQCDPSVVELGDAASGPAVLVVLVAYASGAGARPAAPVPDPVTALMPYLRTDWVFDPRLNRRYLPRRERRPDEYRRDARRLVDALAERATVIRWAHRGDPAPLLGSAP